jgi:hypothetical protein
LRNDEGIKHELAKKRLKPVSVARVRKAHRV